MTRSDAGVSGVVNALLVLSAVASFFVTVQINWVPVWVASHEAEASDALAAALGAWAGEAEAHASRGLLDRPFARALPVGTPGLPVVGAGAASGWAALEALPSLHVTLDGAPLASAAGALRAGLASTRHPAQAHAYALGATELRQHHGAWVDLRGMLAAERATGGELALALRLVGLEGGPSSAGGTRELQVVGVLEGASAANVTGGTVRLVAEGVAADAWRAALARLFDAAALPGDARAGCAASPAAWCLDSGTNDADTLDLTLLRVRDGWTLAQAQVRAELRT